MKRILVGASLTLGLAACAGIPQPPANTLLFELDTVPQGAVVIVGNSIIGTTPARLSIHLNPRNVAQGKVTTAAVVRWPSGAKRQFTQNFSWIPGRSRVHAENHIVVYRPANVPGLNLDLQAAERIAQAAQAAERKRQEGTDALLEGIALGLQTPTTYGQSIHCSSSKVGSFVDTDCR